MNEPVNPPAGPLTWPWMAAVEIPATWTPEQARAVFDLLDDLRDKIWTRYGCQIQALLKDEQGCGCPDHAEPDQADDRSF